MWRVFKVKVIELRHILEQFKDDVKVLLSSDEELNTLFKDIQVAKLSDRKNTIVIWGNSGSEVD